MSGLSSVRDLLRRAVSDSPATTKLVREGRRVALAEEGTHSLMAWPLTALARKFGGKERVNRSIYEHYHRPLKNLDEKAGHALSRLPLGEKLFGQVDVLPTGRKMGGNSTLIEHRTHSATAPISKAVKAVTPLAASLWVTDKLSRKDETKMASDKDELLKQAATALDLAQHRNDAVKLAFTMVEKGKARPFESFEEFEEKVAQIMQKDLRVFEEALAMDTGDVGLGKVAAANAGAPVIGTNPESDFMHRLAAE